MKDVQNTCDKKLGGEMCAYENFIRSKAFDTHSILL